MLMEDKFKSSYGVYDSWVSNAPWSPATRQVHGIRGGGVPIVSLPFRAQGIQGHWYVSVPDRPNEFIVTIKPALLHDKDH